MDKDKRIKAELNKVRDDLRGLFGDSFDDERWKLQEPVMKEILEENSNKLAVLPTAAGKSIIFQYFALFRHKEGVVLVVEPLQSIIDDQIDAFNNLGERTRPRLRAGSVSEYTKNGNNIPKDIAIVFVNPEQLFRYSNKIANLVRGGKTAVQMVVIDEFHTMFEWGSSFRSEFLYIPTFINMIRSANRKRNRELKVLSLTATLNNAETELCKRFLNTEPIKKTDAPILKNDITVTFEKVNRLSDTYVPLTKIIDGTASETGLTQGIAFFKEKKDIVAFKKHLAKSHPDSGEKGLLDNSIHDYQIEIEVEVPFLPGRIKVFRNLVEFTGDLKAVDKDDLLKIINNGDGVYVLATKALAMGVDLQPVTDVQIIGIPESWNCFLQEIGRVRSEGGTYRAFYSFSDALRMLIQLTESEKKNPVCFYDPFVNVMERIKAWDYLCLLDWYLETMPSKSVQIQKAPDGADISLEDLLRKRPEDIRNKLKRIIKSEPKFKDYIEEHNFDDIFSLRSGISDLEQQLLIYINTSKAFISFGHDPYPGIFNGGSARVKSGATSWTLETKTDLSFIDYMVFNALYTCCIYGIEADKNSILKILLGFGYDKKDLSKDEKKYGVLLEYVEKSFARIKAAKIEISTIKQTISGKKKKRISVIPLYEQGSFPIFNEIPELQNRVGVIETAKVRYLFDSIKGKGRNLTAVNIIAIFYTLFGIERLKQIRGSTEETGQNNVFSLPYRTAAVEGALKAWLDLHVDCVRTNKSQEYKRLFPKMKKVLVLEMFPKTDPRDNDEIEEKYNKIIEMAEKIMKAQPPDKCRTEKQREKFTERWEKWNNGDKQKWEKNKKEKLILFIKKKDRLCER